MKTHAIVTTSLRHSFLAGAFLGLTTMASHAAVVTWGAPTGITGDSDVSTTGTLVGAFNIGGPGVANTTVNGTTFTGLALTGNNVTSGNFNLAIATAFQNSNSFGSGSAPFSSLSAPYQALLSSAGGDGNTPFTLTMSGLVTGQTYQFEWWSNNSSVALSTSTTATAGNTVSVLQNTTATFGGVGQFVIGAFIADATTQQVITFGATSSDVLDGFQLRNLSPTAAVPEPGSALAGLLALGVCLSGLAGRSRRQTAAA